MCTIFVLLYFEPLPSLNFRRMPQCFDGNCSPFSNGNSRPRCLPLLGSPPHKLTCATTRACLPGRIRLQHAP